MQLRKNSEKLGSSNDCNIKYQNATVKCNYINAKVEHYEVDSYQEIIKCQLSPSDLKSVLLTKMSCFISPFTKFYCPTIFDIFSFYNDSYTILF